MSGMTEIFLGIIIVGIIMTVKVVMDGFQSITQLNDRITAFRESTRHCEMQLETQNQENADLEMTMQTLKDEVDKLSTQEKEMNREITTLRTDLDGHKTDM